MKECGKKNEQNKLSILLFQHIPQAVQRNRQDKIISYRIKGPEIKPQQHKQRKGNGKIHTLIIHGLQEKNSRNYGKQAEYQKIIFASRQPENQFHQKVKARFRHHIAAHINFMESGYIIPVIIPHIDPQGRRPGHNQKQSK